MMTFTDNCFERGSPSVCDRELKSFEDVTVVYNIFLLFFGSDSRQLLI